MTARDETANRQCYRCGDEVSGRGFPVEINTGPRSGLRGLLQNRTEAWLL